MTNLYLNIKKEKAILIFLTIITLKQWIFIIIFWKKKENLIKSKS